ncbi:hypothetical protein Tco_1568750 [Tanacetum coccineum]
MESVHQGSREIQDCLKYHVNGGSILSVMEEKWGEELWKVGITMVGEGLQEEKSKKINGGMDLAWNMDCGNGLDGDFGVIFGFCVDGCGSLLDRFVWRSLGKLENTRVKSWIMEVSFWRKIGMERSLLGINIFGVKGIVCPRFFGKMLLGANDSMLCGIMGMNPPPLAVGKDGALNTEQKLCCVGGGVGMNWKLWGKLEDMGKKIGLAWMDEGGVNVKISKIIRFRRDVIRTFIALIPRIPKPTKCAKGAVGSVRTAGCWRRLTLAGQGVADVVGTWSKWPQLQGLSWETGKQERGEGFGGGYEPTIEPAARGRPVNGYSGDTEREKLL